MESLRDASIGSTAILRLPLTARGNGMGMKDDSIDCLKALLPNFVSEWIGPTAIVTAAASAGVAVSRIGLAAAGICFYLACSVRGSRAASEKEELNRQAIATLRDYLKNGEKDHAKLKLQLNTIGFDLLSSQDELSQRLASLEALVKTPIATEQQIKDFFAAHDGLLASLSVFIENHFAEVKDALGRQDLKLDDIKAGNAELLAEVRAIGKKLDHIVELLQKQLAEKDGQLYRKDQQLDESGKRESELLKLVATRLTDASDAGDAQATRAIRNVEAGKPAQGTVEFYDARLRETTAQTLQLHRERAVAARAAHDISAAIESYTYITANAPADIDAWNELGCLQHLRGLLPEAETSYRNVLSLASGDVSWEAIAYANVGLVLKTRGDLDGAEAMHRKALAIQEKLDRLERMPGIYNNLGIILKARGDLDGAEHVYFKALEISEKLNQFEWSASLYGNLGIVLKIRGNLDAAEVMQRKALAINETLARLDGMACDYGNIGNVLRARNDLDGAELMYKKALTIEERLGRLEGIANQYFNLGTLLKIRGDPEGAEAMYRKALAINEQLGRLEGMAGCYVNLGVILNARGDSREAEAMYYQAIALLEKLGHTQFMAITYANLGNVAAQRSDIAEARRLWTLSRDAYAKLGATHMAKKLQGWLDSLPPG